MHLVETFPDARISLGPVATAQPTQQAYPCQSVYGSVAPEPVALASDASQPGAGPEPSSDVGLQACRPFVSA